MNTSLVNDIYKKITLICVIAIFSFSLFSCATTLSPQAIQIHDADMATVKNCKYVGDVHGSSGWGNIAASTGIQNAKNEAREQATSMGATHIVWNNISGGYSPYVSGKSYRCE